ncbi:transcriptional regulator, GntR family with UTRA sensor domain containing protein [Actinobacteria bacterium OK074]|nr:transcriptional regulator, GntR family with UTRA sensor domain containing protein [Actinobacteria bacterium OK074]
MHADAAGAPLGPAAGRVAEGVLSMIENGQVRMGGRLPAERRLSELFGASRESVRRALARLEAEGEVRRLRGKAGGTFALRPNPNWPVYGWSRLADGHDRVVARQPGVDVSVPAFLRHQRFAVATRLVSTGLQEGDAEVRAALGLTARSRAVAIERVRLADGVPLSWERLFVSAARFPGILDRDLTGSLSQLFRDVYGVTACRVSEHIRVRLADGSHCGHLDVSTGQPLLAITRTSYDQHGAPLEFSHDLFRADRTELHVSSTTRAPGPGSGPQAAPSPAEGTP